MEESVEFLFKTEASICVEVTPAFPEGALDRPLAADLQYFFYVLFFCLRRREHGGFNQLRTTCRQSIGCVGEQSDAAALPQSGETGAGGVLNQGLELRIMSEDHGLCLPGDVLKGLEQVECGIAAVELFAELNPGNGRIQDSGKDFRRLQGPGCGGGDENIGSEFELMAGAGQTQGYFTGLLFAPLGELANSILHVGASDFGLGVPDDQPDEGGRHVEVFVPASDCQDDDALGKLKILA